MLRTLDTVREYQVWCPKGWSLHLHTYAYISCSWLHITIMCLSHSLESSCVNKYIFAFIPNCIILHVSWIASFFTKKCIATMFVWNLHSFFTWILKLYHAFYIYLKLHYTSCISHISLSSCVNPKITSCVNPEIASYVRPKLHYCMRLKLYSYMSPKFMCSNYILHDSRIIKQHQQPNNNNN